MSPQEYNKMLEQASKSTQALNKPVQTAVKTSPKAPGKTLVEVFAQEPAQELERLKTAFTLKPSRDEEKLNKTEKQFLAELRSRQFPWLGIQCVTLKLGDDCRYTPDFVALTFGGEMHFFEVKGFMQDDARVKIMTAARQFRWATFVLVRKESGKFVESVIHG